VVFFRRNIIGMYSSANFRPYYFSYKTFQYCCHLQQQISIFVSVRYVLAMCSQQGDGRVLKAMFRGYNRKKTFFYFPYAPSSTGTTTKLLIMQLQRYRFRYKRFKSTFTINEFECRKVNLS